MSWGTCYKASNNIHPGFPAMMSEGNLYTDWNSACRLNNNLKSNAGIKSNYSYRQWLINNATRVIGANHTAACGSCCACEEHFKPQPNSNKYIFTSCVDSKQPYGYETSDLKNLYLSKSSLQSRLCAPIMSQSQMLQMGVPNYN